jgi:hypothetical protein
MAEGMICNAMTNDQTEWIEVTTATAKERHFISVDGKHEKTEPFGSDLCPESATAQPVSTATASQ